MFNEYKYTSVLELKSISKKHIISSELLLKQKIQQKISEKTNLKNQFNFTLPTLFNGGYLICLLRMRLT